MVNILRLDSGQTQIECELDTKLEAIQAAYFVTLSPHEHEWTLGQQQAMARYVLWAHQRLSAINQCVDGVLIHEESVVG